MGSTPRAKLLQFQPRRIVAPVLLARVIALSALDTLECNHDPIGFAFFRHPRLSSNSVALNDTRSGRTSLDARRADAERP
jgi:hypothetical protein